MYLMQYDKNRFINGEHINWVDVHDGAVMFTLASDETFYEVDYDFIGSFMNHLQALNDGYINVEEEYRKVAKVVEVDTKGE